MDKLYLRPQSSGYAITPPQNEVVRSELDGGAGNYDAGIEGGTSLVDVNWITDSAGWQYLASFFRNRTARGVEPFLVDLVLEGSPITECTAYFMPGSFKLTGVKGTARFYSAQFEVLPLEEEEAMDSSVVDIWEASGGHPSEYLNAFAAIIAALPDA